jgi:hypothetical protein
VARWRAGEGQSATIALEDDAFTSQVLRFWVNDGSTERPYKEAGRGADGMVVTMDLAASQEATTNLVLLRGSYVSDGAPLTYDLLFSRAGEYRIRAEYHGPGSGAGRDGKPGVMSNSVRIVAEQPKGADADTLALSMENRLVLDGRGSVRQQDRLAKAMASSPGSP